MTVGGAARCSVVAEEADGLFGQSEWHLDQCSCDHLALERNKPRRRQRQADGVTSNDASKLMSYMIHRTRSDFAAAVDRRANGV